MLELTARNFKEEVLDSNKPVLVDFWATWCGPCKMIAPELEKFATLNADKIKVGKVNIDDDTPIALEYGVEVIPTLMLFKDGKVEKKSVGYITAKEMEEKFL
jgi:thioredoxin 1